MGYPKHPDYARLSETVTEYARLKHEYGSKAVQPLIDNLTKKFDQTILSIRKLPIDKNLAEMEPDGYRSILRLRPKGPRRIWRSVDEKVYGEKLGGALLGRMAACTLGSIVEFWSVEKMEKFAKELGQPFPPRDYWKRAVDPLTLRYQHMCRDLYTRDKMDGVPVDDDIVYTLLGLLTVERFGPDFTVEENGRSWARYLPHACSAERVTLENLKKGVPAKQAGVRDNPYCEWIGADIRSDPFGYMAPGWPERAASMAYRDAFLSHRRQGIYGEMFFSAAIAAAFTVRNPLDAIKIGLTEIPANCALAKAVKWALGMAPRIRGYKEARKAVDDHFPGMSGVHTNNNACLTVFGLKIGGTDFTRVAGETVAMGLDNDCTAATAGSIVGAVIGKKGIPAHWTRRFNNKVHSYLIGRPEFRIDDLMRRFTRQVRLIFKE